MEKRVKNYYFNYIEVNNVILNYDVISVIVKNFSLNDIKILGLICKYFNNFIKSCKWNKWKIWFGKKIPQQIIVDIIENYNFTNYSIQNQRIITIRLAE